MKLGVAAFVGEFASGVTTMVFNYLLLALVGNVAVAAYGVIANLALVGVAIFNGISGDGRLCMIATLGVLSHMKKQAIL